MKTPIAYFSKDFFTFFRQLKENNNTAWFHEHKLQFEEAVKKPFLNLLNDVIYQMRLDDPSIVIEPKQALFRINRDIRFSNDKRPYKEHIGAYISLVSAQGKKDPGLYIQMSDSTFFIGGGAYEPQKEELRAIRNEILYNNTEFTSLISAPEFQQCFGVVQGEKNKVVPSPFKDSLAEQPLLANKQFYFWAELSPDAILQPDLAELIMRYYRAGKPFNQFLHRALKEMHTVTGGPIGQ